MDNNADYKILDTRKSFEIDYSLISNLPLFKDTTELIHLVIKLTVNCPKYILETVCQRIIDKLLALLNYIIKALKNQELRLKCINDALDSHTYIDSLISLLMLYTKVGQENSARLDLLMVQIGKLLGGWKKTIHG